MSELESRSNFDSLVPWARRLLAEGKPIGEVMRAIYGVDLAADVYVLDRAYARGLELPLKSLVNHGAGSIERKDVDYVAGMLKAIEQLQREVAGHEADKRPK